MLAGFLLELRQNVLFLQESLSLAVSFVLCKPVGILNVSAVKFVTMVLLKVALLRTLGGKDEFSMYMIAFFIFGFSV